MLEQLKHQLLSLQEYECLAKTVLARVANVLERFKNQVPLTEYQLLAEDYQKLFDQTKLLVKADDTQQKWLNIFSELLLEHHELQQKLQLSEEAVQMTEKRLGQFLEAVPIGIFVVDKYGTPCYSNQKARSILGQGIIHSADVTELPQVYQAYLAGTTQLYPPERQPIVQALQGRESNIDDMEIRQPDKTVPIEVWGTPIFDKNREVAYAIAAFRDITNRKRIEAELAHFIRELQILNRAYERFVPNQFLNLLNKKSILEVELGDQIEKEMTILFSDIRDFTGISETMEPVEVFDFINQYIGRMEPIILDHYGIIDKYIGDAIMVIFPTNANHAVDCAITMLRALSDYNQLLENAGLAKISIGIGLNTGYTIIGTVGGHKRMSGTVLSDAVNLASRVEGLTKIYHIPLLITEQTYRALDNPSQYHVRMVDIVKVRGKSRVVTIYEVYDADSPEIRILKDQTREEFETGFALYHSGEFAKAQRLFEKILQVHHCDEVVLMYFHRCQKMLGLTTLHTAKILIVEDGLTDAEILSHILTKNQFEVAVAKDGESALAIAESQVPHLILLDIILPGIDGFETCRRLKLQPRTREIPVIFVSSLLTKRADIATAFKVGAVDYITKPFHREDVLARVKVHLNIHYLRQQLVDKYDHDMIKEGDYCQM